MTSTAGEATAVHLPVAAKIRQTADTMANSAFRAGIDPDEGLGYWIVWQKNLAYGHADMYEALEAKIDEHKESLDMTISNVRSAAEASMNAVDYKIRHLESDVNRMMGQSISAYGKLLADDTSRWRYIREKKWNLRQNLIGVLGLTTLAVSLVIGGYFWRMGIDTYAMTGVWKCEHGGSIVVNSQYGPFLACPFYEMADPGTVAAIEREFVPPKKK